MQWTHIDGSVALIDAPASVMRDGILEAPAEIEVKKDGVVETVTYIDVQVYACIYVCVCMYM